jgi:CHAD domain-containing protein
LIAATRRSGALYDSERLHAVRIAAKKLRYALEVERALTRSRAVARIARLKRLQDSLGQIHDYEILLERTREVQMASPSRGGASAGQLAALVETLEKTCREGHAAFLRGRDPLIELCQSVITAARDGRPTFTV